MGFSDQEEVGLIWIGFDEFSTLTWRSWSPALLLGQKGSVDQQSCCETSHPTVNHNKLC